MSFTLPPRALFRTSRARSASQAGERNCSSRSASAKTPPSTKSAIRTELRSCEFRLWPTCSECLREPTAFPVGQSSNSMSMA